MAHGLTITLVISILIQLLMLNVQAKGGMDLSILVDSSASVEEENLPHLRNFITNVIQPFYVGSGDEDTRVAIASFSDQVHESEVLLLSDGQSKQAIETYIAEKIILRDSEELAIGKAMQFAGGVLFATFVGARLPEEVPHILVLLTDGGSAQDDLNIRSTATTLKSDYMIAVYVVAVGSLEPSLVSNLQKAAFNSSTYIAVEGFSSLGDHVQELVQMLPASSESPGYDNTTSSPGTDDNNGSDGSEQGPISTVGRTTAMPLFIMLVTAATNLYTWAI